jgi:serine/threonine protein kinase
MAPEVLQGQPASIASDLYAVGVMAYELFAEKYLYEMVNVTKLINDIIFTEPDIASLGLDPLLESILTRLLAKDPAQRFSDARELIKIYAEATDQAVKYETDTIRESFLQAARFVGREQELAANHACWKNCAHRLLCRVRWRCAAVQ